MGTFVGDALGMPVEGMSAIEIERTHGRLNTMLEARLGAGTYTDDTQMMVATTKSLVECDGVDRVDLSQQYLEHFDRERGYGAGTTQVLRRWKQGESIDRASTRIFDGGSYGNGGAMRIAPVAVFFQHDVKRLKEAVRKVVSLTHAHPRGIGGAFIQARSIVEALGTDPPADTFYPSNPDHDFALEFLKSIRDDVPDQLNPDSIWDSQFERARELLGSHGDPPPPRIAAKELGCDSTTKGSVLTALFAVLINLNSFENVVSYAVNIGGDTDTIGAMAGAISGALHGVGHIPDSWWGELENGKDGRDEVIEWGLKLASMSGEHAE